MSNAFRELLKKIGSGPHTGKDLTREEAAQATEAILTQEATPAQIGAFLIAHRIKRPTSEELAGMLDTYDQLGMRLKSWPNAPTVTIMGTPYDGRSRHAPVTVLTALILSAAGVPVIQHGGDVMPTKYGIPLKDIWQGLGADFTQLSLPQVQNLLEKTGIGFLYLPQQFPLAQGLVTYRDQIGKRPPFATVELIWPPYQGEFHLAAGFVHPPTEQFMQGALALRGVKNYTLIKGLEGSCDLPRDRTTIISVYNPDNPEIQRLKLNAKDYNLGGKEVPLTSETQLFAQMQGLLQGKALELLPAVLWNGGFYLWRCGICEDLETAIGRAESLLTSGQVSQKLEDIKKAIA
ncbi:anthranilate phosphoribosyltransferase family protein [Spirulina sp. 06S082]|uniref:anthranilate phosphoribosyltransferase family protein n=1 Tax=Spirulina sp. 06S082 TaxID=3110248 RepID=UPI002B21BC0E|nr:anthranilate phosphoribosyltransferase family protein [Spirulina sp. 06S082]MEA5467890.1 anthranilate phosphoribosyltransferase family protein [Spirulina sp. 06S082]